MAVRGNLLEASSAMPPEQGWLMRLDVSGEMLTGNRCQCARSMVFGGRNVAPVVTASLKVGDGAMDETVARCSASDELEESARIMTS
jgi:hypothetical protein